MPSNYTGRASRVAQGQVPVIACPVGTDAPNAASVNHPLQTLADFVALQCKRPARAALPGLRIATHALRASVESRAVTLALASRAVVVIQALAAPVDASAPSDPKERT